MPTQYPDIDRFADRSRELWSAQTMTNENYKENNFLRCCGNCPFASLLALVLTLTGTISFCLSLRDFIPYAAEIINNAFGTEYIYNEWIQIFKSAMIFTFAIMAGLSFTLLIVGLLATGATRHKVFSGFRSRLGGRITIGLFIFIVYILLITWLIIMLCMMIPSIGFYILKYRCDSSGFKTMSDFPGTMSPYTCITPGTYGIPAPSTRPDAQACQEKFVVLCNLTKSALKVWAASIGSFLVVLGLIHFLLCLVANYAHVKDGRKLRDYEEVIREEIETSKLN